MEFLGRLSRTIGFLGQLFRTNSVQLFRAMGFFGRLSRAMDFFGQFSRSMNFGGQLFRVVELSGLFFLVPAYTGFLGNRVAQYCFCTSRFLRILLWSSESSVYARRCAGFEHVGPSVDSERLLRVGLEDDLVLARVRINIFNASWLRKLM